jgi:ferric-dicitrate binding protein FerR (iron transport regulator)
MAEIARQIERWYNVKVTISDKTLEKYTFRATFQDDKLEDVLKYLAMTSPLSYRIIPRKIVDGTYKKQEIIIYSNK